MFGTASYLSRNLIYPQVFFDLVDYFTEIFFSLWGTFMHQVIDFFIQVWVESFEGQIF